MFIAALFTIGKIWNQSKCPSMDKWVKKMLHIYIYVCVYINTHICTYIHTMEYYLAVKKNEILLFATTWTDLEGINA